MTPEQCIVYWEEQIELQGYEIVKTQIKEDGGRGQSPFIRAALEKYDRKQEDEKDFKRDKREEETLKLARDANRISRKANLHGLLAIGISVVAVFVAVLLAFAEKQG